MCYAMMKLRLPLRKVAAEFFGTMIFLYIVAASAVVPRLYVNATPGLSLLFAAFIQGLALVAIVTAFDGISGSHFNPAITSTLMLLRSLPGIHWFLYLFAQFSGASVGAVLASATFGKDATLSAVTRLAPGVTIGSAITLEFFVTCILLLVVVSSATSLESAMAPVPIGFSVLVGVLLAGGVTGGSMNPARSFGPALLHNDWRDFWIYVVAPCMACIAVSLLHHFVFRSKDDEPAPEPAVTDLV